MIHKIIANWKKILIFYGIAIIFTFLIFPILASFFVPESDVAIYRNWLAIIIFIVPSFLIWPFLFIQKLFSFFYPIKKRFYRKKDKAVFQELKVKLEQKGFQEIDSKKDKILIGATEGGIVLLKVEVNKIWTGVPIISSSDSASDIKQNLPIAFVYYRKISRTDFVDNEDILINTLESFRKSFAEMQSRSDKTQKKYKTREGTWAPILIEEKHVEEVKKSLENQTRFFLSLIKFPKWLDASIHLDIPSSL